MTEFKLKLPETKRGRKSKEDKLLYNNQMQEFGGALIELGNRIKQKVSARGWCYLLEGYGLITKDQFDYAQKLINKCRKKCFIPIDFIATDDSRRFYNVGDITNKPADGKRWILSWLAYVKDVYKRKNDIAFWESQEYYIQMMVEKIDVLNLFNPVCKKYHIPIANAKGWSDMNSRNEMAQRFKEAEGLGLKPVLLYYGDFDPAGRLIADQLRKNLRQIRKASGWDPKNLAVDRFGLTYDFIEENDILWIDNLITGSGKDLANPKHKDHKKAYVQEYITKYGVRKCEANAILPMKEKAKEHCEETIKKYLGEDPFKIYQEKLAEGKEEVKKILDSVNFSDRIEEIIDDIKKVESD